MAEYIDRTKIQYREIVDYYDEQNMCEIHCDVADKVKIDRLPTADVVERSKIDDTIKEMKALAAPENTILGFDEKMGLKTAMNILVRNVGGSE